MLLLEHRSQRKPYSIRTEGFNCRQVPKPIRRLSSADVSGVWYSGGNLFSSSSLFVCLFVVRFFFYLFSLLYVSTYSDSNYFWSLTKLNITLDLHPLTNIVPVFYNNPWSSHMQWTTVCSFKMLQSIHVTTSVSFLWVCTVIEHEMTSQNDPNFAVKPRAQRAQWSKMVRKQFVIFFNDFIAVK